MLILSTDARAADAPSAVEMTATSSAAVAELRGDRYLLDKDFWIETVASAEQLVAYLADWTQLSRETLEPNVFYEPWFLLPGLKALHTEDQCEFVFVYRRNKRQTDPPILCGFFPFLSQPVSYLKWPRLRLLTNIYSYLATPLLHPLYCTEALTAVFRWGKAKGYALIDFPRTQGEGLFQQALIEVLNEREMTTFTAEQYSRALLVRAENYEVYQTSLLRGHNRRDMNRLRRRLEEQGPLEFRSLDQSGTLTEWVENFLQLEQQGWKGENGTALSQEETHADFFRQVTQQAWENRQLQMLGLFLNGEPIALKCNLLSGRGSYAWKIAYQESLAKFSPGVQLEQENIQYFHEETPLEWMDSCAAPGHPMINRLWGDRRIIQCVQVSTGSFRGDWLTALRPVIRLLRKRKKK